MANAVSTYQAPGGGGDTPTFEGANLTLEESSTPNKIDASVDSTWFDDITAEGWEVGVFFGDGITPPETPSDGLWQFITWMSSASFTSNGSFDGDGTITGRWYLRDENDAPQVQVSATPFAMRPIITGNASPQETTASVTINTNTSEGTIHRVINTSATLLGAATIKSTALFSDAVASAGGKVKTHSNLTESTTYYEHAVHEVIAGGVSYFSDEQVTSFTTLAEGGGSGTGGGSGAHNSTVNNVIRPSPYYTESGNEIRVETLTMGQVGSGFTPTLITIDGVDYTNAWSGGSMIAPDGVEGTLKITGTYGGQSRTAEGYVFAWPEHISNPIFADIAGGNGRWAMIPPYQSETGTINASEVASWASSAPNGSSVVVRNGSVSNMVLRNLGNKQLTIKAASLHGVEVDNLDIGYSHNLKIIGFKITNFGSRATTGSGYNNYFEGEYLQMRSINIWGEYGSGISPHGGVVKLKYCVSRQSGGQHQWGLWVGEAHLVQSILWPLTNQKDFFNVGGCRRIFVRHCVFGDVIYSFPPGTFSSKGAGPHADAVQPQQNSGTNQEEDLSGLVCCNIVFDNNGSNWSGGGTWGIDNAFQFITAKEMFDFCFENNLIDITSGGNSAQFAQFDYNCVLRHNSNVGSLRPSELSNPNSVRWEDNVATGNWSTPLSTFGPSARNYTNFSSEYPNNRDSDPFNWQDYQPTNNDRGFARKWNAVNDTLG